MTPHCLDPPVKGMISCYAYFPKIVFNSKSLKCERYIYGGCGASANMFDGLEQCQTTCYHGQFLMSPQVPNSPR